MSGKPNEVVRWHVYMKCNHNVPPPPLHTPRQYQTVKKGDSVHVGFCTRVHHHFRCRLKMGRRKTAAIWNYYSAVAKDTAKCSFCGKKYKFKDGNTSGLAKHLKTIHGKRFENDTFKLKRVDSRSGSTSQGSSSTGGPSEGIKGGAGVVVSDEEVDGEVDDSDGDERSDGDDGEELGGNQQQHRQKDEVEIEPLEVTDADETEDIGCQSDLSSVSPSPAGFLRRPASSITPPIDRFMIKVGTKCFSRRRLCHSRN